MPAKAKAPTAPKPAERKTKPITPLCARLLMVAEDGKLITGASVSESFPEVKAKAGATSLFNAIKNELVRQTKAGHYTLTQAGSDALKAYRASVATPANEPSSKAGPIIADPPEDEDGADEAAA